MVINCLYNYGRLRFSLTEIACTTTFFFTGFHLEEEGDNLLAVQYIAVQHTQKKINKHHGDQEAENTLLDRQGNNLDLD